MCLSYEEKNMIIEDLWNHTDRMRLERENSPSGTWPTIHPTWNKILRPVLGSDSPGNIRSVALPQGDYRKKKCKDIFISNGL